MSLKEPLENNPETVKAMKEILSIADVETVHITENEFIHRLLPILTNYNGEQDLGAWIDVAGSPFLPIKVQNNSGEVIFTVPPIWHRPTLRGSRHHRDSMSDIIAKAKLKAEVIPQMGDRYLRSRLGDRLVSGDIDLEEVKIWNQILARYGYPPITKIVDNDEPVESTGKLATQAHGDVFTGEWDEF